jgi:hypothetical protein
MLLRTYDVDAVAKAVTEVWRDTRAALHAGQAHRTEAAAEYNARKAVGLDGALNKLSHNSYGPFLLGVAAAGLIGFALYSIADARYRKI